jgi:pyruvate,water dikinase
MIRSDLAVSGVLFTLDPETGFRDLIVINSSYGLGESVVRGSVNPDEYWVYKPLLEEGLVPIIKRDIGSKKLKIIYDANHLTETVEVAVPDIDQKAGSLSDIEILELAQASVLIERHFSSRREKPTPMDIEWAKDGLSGKLYIVQARPETVQSARGQGAPQSELRYFIEESGPVLARGRSVGAQVRSGKARIIASVKDLHQLRENEILVTSKTDPDWEPVMRRAAAIVTNQGGRTCHAAIMARELGIPAVVGTGNGTATIPGGEMITVSSAEGDVGSVYLGASRFRTEPITGSAIIETKTKIMINLGRSEEAIQCSFLPVAGVGLARMEFMITSGIAIHPMALAHLDRVKDLGVRTQITQMIPIGEEPKDYFVRRLSEQIGVMAAAFFPRPVILRMSDFKSNEYAHLLGGADFEVQEENPAIGFRGAFRYSNDRYRDGFHLECEAIRKVRLEMGLTNLEVMIPFCRTLQDAQNALQELEVCGVRRGESGLKVWMMCEVPSNVVLAKEFASLFDGFSIGSNDLTQLILGVDRDSEALAGVFNENDAAVKEMIRSVIRSGKESGIPIGICGQAPSDDPGFTRFLVHEGIDSLSLSPDSVMKVRPWVEHAEQERRKWYEA